MQCTAMQRAIPAAQGRGAAGNCRPPASPHRAAVDPETRHCPRLQVAPVHANNIICSSSAQALTPSGAQCPGGAPTSPVAESFQRCPRGHAGFCGTTHWSSQTLRWRRKCLALGPGCGMALTRRRLCCTGPEWPEASATGPLRCRVSQLRAPVDVTSID